MNKKFSTLKRRVSNKYLVSFPSFVWRCPHTAAAPQFQVPAQLELERAYVRIPRQMEERHNSLIMPACTYPRTVERTVPTLTCNTDFDSSPAALLPTFDYSKWVRQHLWKTLTSAISNSYVCCTVHIFQSTPLCSLLVLWCDVLQPAVLPSSILKTCFTSQILSPYAAALPHSQTTFIHRSTMTTTTPTILNPHPPLAPVLLPVATDSDSIIPELSLPPSLATTQTVLLPNISADPSPSTTNRHQPLRINPVSALTTATQSFPMTIPLHPIRNSSRHSASPLPSPAPYAGLPAAPTQVLPSANMNCAPDEAHQ